MSIVTAQQPPPPPSSSCSSSSSAPTSILSSPSGRFQRQISHLVNNSQQSAVSGMPSSTTTSATTMMITNMVERISNQNIEPNVIRTANNNNNQIKLNINARKVQMVLAGHSPSAIESVDSSTPTPEAPSVETPPVFRWSRDFHSLIEDIEGVKLFKEYLDDEGLSLMFNFYFACQGLKKSDPKDRRRLILAILKKFIVKTKILRLPEECHKRLIDLYTQLRNQSNETSIESQPIAADANTFDEAYRHVEYELSGSIYDNFLNSQLFINYRNNQLDPVQNHHHHNTCPDQNSSTPVKQASSLSLIDEREGQTKTGERFVDQLNDDGIKIDYRNNRHSLMETIDEVTSEDNKSTIIEAIITHQPSTNVKSQTSFSHSQPTFTTTTRLKNALFNPKANVTYKEYLLPELDSVHPPPLSIGSDVNIQPPHPYHAARYSSIQCTSKKDSEIESISSSDSSFYTASRNEARRSLGNPNVSRRVLNPGNQPSSQLAALKQAQQQQDKLNPNNNPDEFARKLIEKLNKVRIEQESNMKLHSKLMALYDRSSSPPPSTTFNSVAREAGVGQHSAGSQITTKQKPSIFGPIFEALSSSNLKALKPDEGQDILDKHFAQVFNEPSNASTPAGSSTVTAGATGNVISSFQQQHYSNTGTNQGHIHCHHHTHIHIYRHTHTNTHTQRH